MSLRVSKLSHRYGANQALSDISLEIDQGEQVALIGSSGCGKTTLLNLLGTRLSASEGGLTILDDNPNQLKPSDIRKLRTKIAMIPQHLGLVPNVRVIRNVLNGGLGKIGLLSTLRQLLWLKENERMKVFDLLKRTGISEKIYDRTDSLSGGQQQRVSVARALYQKPSIILADEPVSAVDPERAKDTISLLTQLSKEENVTLIVSLHNLELAREFFPRLVGLRHGEIKFDRSPDELSKEECQSLYQLEK